MKLFAVFQYDAEYSQPTEVKIIWANSKEQAISVYKVKEELFSSDVVEAKIIPNQFQFADYPKILLEL